MTEPAESFSRRDLVRRAVALAAVSPLAAPFVNRGRHELFASTPWAQEFSERAVRLVREATVIDMLSPLKIAGDDVAGWMRDPSSFTERDFAYYRDSGINVFHPTGGGTAGRDTHENVLTYLAEWNGFIAYHSDWFVRVTDPGHLDRVNESGKIGVILGLQNSAHFNDVDDVDLFYGLGQRVSQLTYNSQNRIATGTMEGRDGGISDFGEDVVRRMNEVGMAVDVSHCGDQTTLDAFEISSRPVLITHSNARALNPGYFRCKTDEAIRRMAESGGVMGITMVRSFVSGEEPTTLDSLLDHFDHVARLVGVEHVGIGADTDINGGYDASPPEAWERIGGRYRAEYQFRDKIDMDEMPTQKRTYLLTEGLIGRGYGDEEIRMMLGENFRRVLKEIWTV
ncbi:MAG: dipeptidase [Gemmatimonadota bacterium]|nr:dipeptidase [Gemmatimonadota bacterium]